MEGVRRRAREVEEPGLPELVQHRPPDPVPHPGGLPVPQPAPAGHAAGAQLAGEHLPRHAPDEGEQDAREAGAVVAAGPSSLGRGRLGRQMGPHPLPKAVVQNPFHGTLDDGEANRVLIEVLRIMIDRQPMETIIAFNREDRIPVRNGSETVLHKQSTNSDPLRSLLEQVASLDIGVLVLREYYVRHLQAAGVVPFTREDTWRIGQEELFRALEARAVSFFAVGFPASELRLDSHGNLINLACKYLPLWPVDGSPQCLRFAPNWTEDFHSGSVQGVSGGPVIAMIGDDVHWFGIQASEYAVEGKTPKELWVSEAGTVLDFLTLLHVVARQLQNSQDDFVES